MTYKFDSRFVGYPPIETILAATAPSGVTPWPPVTPGAFATAEDPVWGPGEFIFGKINGTIRRYGLCVNIPAWNSTTRTYDQLFTECPNTTIMGRPVYVLQGDINAANIAAGWAWFMQSGLTPVNGSASVAADTTASVVAAGQLGALAAGKQIVNARVMGAATQTVAKTCLRGDNGSDQLYFSNVDGFFVGAYLSGTGVGASAIINAIDRANNVITASVVSTASVAGQSVTATYNNATIFYNVLQMNRAFAQGAIT